MATLLPATWTCHECAAREMSRSEYVTHLSMVHDIRLTLRSGRETALAVSSSPLP